MGAQQLSKWALRFGVALAVGGILSGAGTAVFVGAIERELPSVADLKGSYHPPQVTRVLARDGTLLAELFTERRTVVPLAQVPNHVKLAVLAAEDASFYEHEGLNYWGILRAFAVNLRAGRTRQGGSTITQQVVKNVLHDAERTYRRKLREALLARKLEQELTKDDILELYLNQIYFGHGRYGVEEAAHYYFGKAARELTVSEGALLAGIVAGPESFSPRKDLPKALARRDFVLEQMKEKGFLTDAQRAAAQAEPVRLAPPVEAKSELAPEAVEMARKALAQLEPERSKQGGFTITTSIDPRMQEAARKAVREALVAYDRRHALTGPLKPPKPPKVPARGATASRQPAPRATGRDAPFEGTPSFDAHRTLVGVVVSSDDARGTFDVRVGTALGSVRLADYERYNPQHLAASAFAPEGALVRVSLLAPVPSTAEPSDARVPLRLELGPEGALVALDGRDRSVLALVGNYEAAAGALDRATQAKRQPGSTFKPIVYSYALHARRFTPATLVDPTPETFENGYKPANYEGWTGLEPIRLREALAQSVNLVAVRVLRDVGPTNVVSWAQSLGVRSRLEPDLSLALGSYEVSPLELAGAYATFAAGGTYDEPRVLTRIVGPDGREVPLDDAPPPRRVLEEAEAYLITNMLGSVVDHGTAVRAKQLARPVAGKTGTSNGPKDTWFAGYSTDVVAVVWVGFDDGKALGAETGGQLALPAWVQFMGAAHAGRPSSDFPRPAGIVTTYIDAKTGQAVAPDAPNAMEELFLAGTEPAPPEAEPKEPEDIGGGPIGPEREEEP
jgi:penicillin-binding protein 1A